MSKQTPVSCSATGVLPTEIEGFDFLAELAPDLRSSWKHDTDDIWRQLDPALWELTQNPWGVLQTVSKDKLASVLANPAGMVVCTLGTDTSPLIKTLDLPLEKGRLKTDADMKVTRTANLWAIGDCAFIPNAYTCQASPATAQFAMQQARQLAANLKRVVDGKPATPFSYRPRGMIASIGHHDAVADIYGINLSGLVAWFLWRGIYLFKLPTLSGKLEVAIGWAWSIFFAPNIVQISLRRSSPTKETDHGNGRQLEVKEPHKYNA